MEIVDAGSIESFGRARCSQSHAYRSTPYSLNRLLNGILEYSYAADFLASGLCFTSTSLVKADDKSLQKKDCELIRRCAVTRCSRGFPQDIAIFTHRVMSPLFEDTISNESQTCYIHVTRKIDTQRKGSYYPHLLPTSTKPCTSARRWVLSSCILVMSVADEVTTPIPDGHDEL